jgi:hypothetical protein
MIFMRPLRFAVARKSLPRLALLENKTIPCCPDFAQGKSAAEAGDFGMARLLSPLFRQNANFAETLLQL